MATGQDIPKDMWSLLDNVTLVMPPDGVVPDVVHRQAHRYPITIAASVCLPIVLALAIVRIYTKRCILRRWGFDDYVFMVSVPAGVSMIALNIATIHGGAYGYHAWDVTVGDLTKAVLERSVALMILQGPITWLVKLALFSLILTAFQPIIWLRRLVYIGIVVTGFFYLYCAIYAGVACGPKGGVDRASYLAGMAGKMCHDPTGFIQINNITQGAFGVFSDLYLLVIPVPAIMKLQLPAKRKLGVLVIFMAGLGACAMSVVALRYRISIYKTQDNNYDIVALLTVNTIEISVGMMIPTFASMVTFAKYINSRVREHLSTKYGWGKLQQEQSVFCPAEAVAENEMETRRKKILPNGKTYSQSDTIDKMVFGVYGNGFHTESGASSDEHCDKDHVSIEHGASTEKMV